MPKDLLRASYSMGEITVYYQFEQFSVTSDLFGLRAYKKIADKFVTPDMSKDEADKIKNEIEEFMSNEQYGSETRINEELKVLGEKFEELVKGVVQKHMAEAESNINDYVKKR